MESNKFFIFIRRLNSIMLMLLLLGGGASLLYFNIMENHWHDERTVTLKEGQENNQELELVLGRLNTVAGSSVLYITLREQNDKTSFSSSGDSLGGTRNVLFFKDKELKPNWLFESNGNLIREMNELKVGEYDDKNPTLAFLYEMIYKDTNNNNELDNRDKISIALSKPDGSEFRNIIDSIDSLIDHKVSNDGKEVALIYQNHHKVYLERVSLLNFQSISKSELTQIEKR